MDKKTALVTGASSGIGQALAKSLLKEGYFVIAVSRKPERGGVTNADLLPLRCDLSRPEMVTKCAGNIRGRFDRLDLLVNNAGAGFFGLHEGLDPADVTCMVNLNLTAPLIFTSRLLPLLRKAKGHIINISSITAKRPSPMGSAYAATKAGLLHFSNCLFDEVRKNGVKVTALCPDMTMTPFFDKLDFAPAAEEGAFLTPELIAESVMFIVKQPPGSVVTELVLRPQLHRLIRKKQES